MLPRLWLLVGSDRPTNKCHLCFFGISEIEETKVYFILRESLFPFGLVQNTIDTPESSMIMSKKKGNRPFSSNIWLLPVLPRQMLLKVTRWLAWETALITGVGLFSGVSALVYFQITRVSARIVALVTLERFHSWMGPNVCLKIKSMFERVVTLCATERVFSRVCQHVAL